MRGSRGAASPAEGSQQPRRGVAVPSPSSSSSHGGGSARSSLRALLAGVRTNASPTSSHASASAASSSPSTHHQVGARSGSPPSLMRSVFLPSTSFAFSSTLKRLGVHGSSLDEHDFLSITPDEGDAALDVDAAGLALKKSNSDESVLTTAAGVRGVAGRRHTHAASSSPSSSSSTSSTPHQLGLEQRDALTSLRVTPAPEAATEEAESTRQVSHLAPPVNRVRSRSASLPARVREAIVAATTAQAAPPSSDSSASSTSTTASPSLASSSSTVTTPTAPVMRNDADAVERLRLKRHYYRRLAYPRHTAYETGTYLPGERTLMDHRATKCIGLELPNADICVISGSLVLTSFRLIFDPSSGVDFLKERLGLEDGARVMTLTNIASAERTAKRITLFGKDGHALNLLFSDEKSASNFHQQLLKLPKTERLFAFSYFEAIQKPRQWSYDPYLEFARMGVTEDGASPWRISHVNESFKISSTYPPVLVVPKDMSDQEIIECAKYRVKGRVPTMCWRSGTAVICRSSQPRVGILGFTRSIADEKFINALSAINPSVPVRIIDVRPKLNAVMNKAKGGGYESYPNTILSFLDVDNIHVMQDSINTLRKAIIEGTIRDESQLDWFDRTGRLLSAVYDVVRHMAVYPGAALVHCSDGWDRTSIVCSLMELLMDSYYRTIHGFFVLVEKEWLSFGHQFHKRCGHDQLGEDLKTQSPIFLQFIDCVWTTMQLFPNDFEFNEEFLLFILDNLNACKHGTFLFDSEYERRQNKLEETTTSLWDEAIENIALFRNRDYIYKRRLSQRSLSGKEDTHQEEQVLANGGVRRRSGTVTIMNHNRSFGRSTEQQAAIVSQLASSAGRRPKSRKTIDAMQALEIERVSSERPSILPLPVTPISAKSSTLAALSLSPRTPEDLPQKILVPSPNALSFLSPSQRVWSNYYLRWLPEKEGARLERMIVKQLMLIAKRKLKRKSNRTVNGTVMYCSSSGRETAHNQYPVSASFGTKPPIVDLAAEPVLPSCSLADANRHLATGDICLWLTSHELLNKEMDVFTEKQFTQAGLIINKTEAYLFDNKGWGEVIETAKGATHDDVLFVWYMTDSGEVEVSSLRWILSQLPKGQQLLVRHLQLELTAHAMHNLNVFIKLYKNRNKTHWIERARRMQPKKLRSREGWEELFEAQHIGLAYERMGILPVDGSSLPSNTAEPTSGLNALMMNVNSQFSLEGGRARPPYYVKHFTSAVDLDLVDGCIEEEVVILASDPGQEASSSAADQEEMGKWQDTKIILLEARDMRPGKSRPKATAANIYCVLSSVARLRQSSVCWHTPHPVWNEQYFVGVSDSVSIQVLDKSDSTASDDLLGVMDVPLIPLPLDREVDLWLPLKSTTPNALPGEIHVKIKKQSTLGKLVAHLQVDEDSEDDYDEEEEEQDNAFLESAKPMDGSGEAIDTRQEEKLAEPVIDVTIPTQIDVAIPTHLAGTQLCQRRLLADSSVSSSADTSATDMSDIGSVEEEEGLEGELGVQKPIPRRQTRMLRNDSEVGSIGRRFATKSSSFEDIFEFEEDS